MNAPLYGTPMSAIGEQTGWFWTPFPENYISNNCRKLQTKNKERNTDTKNIGGFSARIRCLLNNLFIKRVSFLSACLSQERGHNTLQENDHVCSRFLDHKTKSCSQSS